jgi:hypothetical protein
VSKPKRQAFGIVGVNEGLANTTNPCLATEIAWAPNSSGTAKRSKASFYLNTANPGHHGAPDWPVNNDNPITGVLGMVAYFHGIGSPAGIYSLPSQWHQIAGTVTSNSSLYYLADWIPGARTLSQAKANCRALPLTRGGIVIVTQWTASSTNTDFSCR